jgi:hypothetical protein
MGWGNHHESWDSRESWRAFLTRTRMDELEWMKDEAASRGMTLQGFREWLSRRETELMGDGKTVPKNMRRPEMGGPMQHSIKCHTPPFEQTWWGLKTFEFRRRDRPYKVGDTLELIEWHREGHVGNATGYTMLVEVTHMLRGDEDAGGMYSVPYAFCIMSIRVLGRFRDLMPVGPEDRGTPPSP